MYSSRYSCKYIHIYLYTALQAGIVHGPSLQSSLFAQWATRLATRMAARARPWTTPPGQPPCSKRGRRKSAGSCAHCLGGPRCSRYSGAWARANCARHNSVRSSLRGPSFSSSVKLCSWACSIRSCFMCLFDHIALLQRDYTCSTAAPEAHGTMKILTPSASALLQCPRSLACHRSRAIVLMLPDTCGHSAVAECAGSCLTRRLRRSWPNLPPQFTVWHVCSSPESIPHSHGGGEHHNCFQNRQISAQAIATPQGRQPLGC